jgi:phage terminase large subunit GpA-like protein
MPKQNVTASFWVSGLASPWQSFGDIARRMVAAYATNDQDRIQAEVNTYGGEIFKIQGDAPPWDEVRKLIMPYPRRSLPAHCQMITAGVDVQKFGLYYTIRGWGYMSESWLIDHGYIAGETEFDNVWIALYSVLDQKFEGRQINRAFIDSGFAADRVYDFVRRTGGHVFASKGQDRLDKPLKTATVDVTSYGKMIKAGVKLWHVNTDYFKSQVYSRIRWPLDQPGGWHLHEETDEDYCRQLVAESRVVKPSGRHVWVRNYKDNHYLDCEVLAFAAATSLQVHALREQETRREDDQKIQRPVDKPHKPFINPPRQNWIRR